MCLGSTEMHFPTLFPLRWAFFILCTTIDSSYTCIQVCTMLKFISSRHSLSFQTFRFRQWPCTYHGDKSRICSLSLSFSNSNTMFFRPHQPSLQTVSSPRTLEQISNHRVPHIILRNQSTENPRSTASRGFTISCKQVFRGGPSLVEPERATIAGSTQAPSQPSLPPITHQTIRKIGNQRIFVGL